MGHYGMQKHCDLTKKIYTVIFHCSSNKSHTRYSLKAHPFVMLQDGAFNFEKQAKMGKLQGI